MAPQIKKRLLALSWAMPPMLFPRSIQVARLLKALSAYGWDITVIHSDPQQAGSEADSSLAQLYEGGYKTIQIPLDALNPQPADALMSQWFKPALSAVKNELKSNKYSVWITFAQPWVDHLIGLEARKFANIPWLAHFSDPWVDSPYYAGVDKKQLEAWRKKERDIICYADAVLFTNTQASELVMRKYPSKWSKKSFVIPHAYDSNLADRLNVPSHNNKRLRLVYAGDFYGPRTPRWFLQALSMLSQSRPLDEELEVCFIGRVSAEEKQAVSDLGLNNIVVFQDQVPYMQSLQDSATADVLLLIDAPSVEPSPFLPSKLVDYLTFKKPIFGLTPKGGVSALFLEQLGYAAVEPNDVSAIADALTKLISDWRLKNVSVSSRHIQNAANYDSREVGRNTDKILSDIMVSYSQKRWWQTFVKYI